MIPTGEASSLLIRLFGPFEARLNGQPLVRLRYRKSQSVLALLALRRGSPAERRWLTGLLWPDSLDGQMLRNCLSDLRRALGPQACRLQCPTPQTLALDLSQATVDVLAFDDAIARGDPAALEEAVALYRGPLLEGCSEEWAFQERQCREQAFLAALEKLAALALERGEPAVAEGHLRRAVATDPLWESAQRALMRVLAAGGNFAAALLVYRELRLRLHRELNTEPDAETKTLFQQLRMEGRRLSAKGSGGAYDPSGAAKREGRRSVGPGPNTAHSDRALDFPRLTSPPAPAHNLPLALTRFIGREREMAEVMRLLGHAVSCQPSAVSGKAGGCQPSAISTGEHVLTDSREPTAEGPRLLTLIGAGGCGKTRLGLQAAAGLLEAYPDGVWLVELAPLAELSLVPQTTAAALGVREQPGRPMVETLVEALKPKRLLLVLDNCEHLVAACARLAETLLKACPGLRILATSREPLGIPGETTYRVPSLSLPPVVDGSWLMVDGPAKTGLSSPSTINHQPSTYLQSEAARLFVERAESAVPSFAVTPENASAITEICCRLDGIPLAIELAAARVKALSVEKLAERLDDMFRLLTGGSRTALPRHQTLRALIDWSYDLLSEAERALLRQLSVFARGWTLEAAESVCAGEGIGGPEVLGLLTALVDKSLVLYGEPTPLSGATAGAAEPRYRLLETVRQYARDRLLEAGEEAGVRKRHLSFFLDLAEAAEPKLRSPAKKVWLERLESEHDNFRSALAWSLTEAGAGESGLRLAGALWWYWLLRDHWSDSREWLERELARSDADQHSPARAKVLEGAGFMTSDRARGEESVALFRELGDPLGLAGSLRTLGLRLTEWGDLAAARTLYEESLGICQQQGDRWGLIPSLWGLGQLAFLQSDYASAQSLWEECVRVCREADDQWNCAWSLDGLGRVAQRRSDWGSAHAYYKEGLSLFRDLGNQWGMVYGLAHLAEAANGRGNPERAARLFGTVEALRGPAGETLPAHELADADRHIAAARADLGEEAYAAAWRAGWTMTPEQAITEALQGDSDPGEGPTAGGRGGDARHGGSY